LAALAVSEYELGNLERSAGFIKRVLRISERQKFALRFSRTNRLNLKAKPSLVSQTDKYTIHIDMGDKFNDRGFYDKAALSYLKALSLSDSSRQKKESLASLIPSTKCSSRPKLTKIYIDKLLEYKSHKKWAKKQRKRKFKCEQKSKPSYPSKTFSTEACSKYQEYACQPREKRNVAKRMCLEYFSACDFSKKAQSLAQEYRRKMNCDDIHKKFFGDEYDKWMLTAATELTRGNKNMSEATSIAHELFQEAFNMTRKVSQSQLFSWCTKAASQACTNRLEKLKQCSVM